MYATEQYGRVRGEILPESEPLPRQPLRQFCNMQAGKAGKTMSMHVCVYWRILSNTSAVEGRHPEEDKQRERKGRRDSMGSLHYDLHRRRGFGRNHHPLRPHEEEAEFLFSSGLLN